MTAFSVFANILYSNLGLKLGKAQFVRKLISSIINYPDDDLLANVDDDMMRKFLRGNRDISSVAREIMRYVDTTCFAMFLDENCSEDATLAIQKALSEIGVQVQMESFSDDVAAYFYTLLSESIANDDAKGGADSNTIYLNAIKKRCDGVKTLLFEKEDQQLNSFYIPNDVFTTKNDRKKAIKVLLEGFNHYMVIQGSGGIGKSMMMRYLALELAHNFDKYGKIPIFVQLNDFNSSGGGLLSIIRANTTKLHGLIEKLEAGKCVLLLDAMDEIPSTEYSNFCKELNRFVEEYPDNTYILSSRPVSKFIEIRHFSVYELAPFTKEQAIAMIRKVKYRPETPSLKASFIQEIEEKLYETHRDFVENPLLLTIMLKTYERYARIPSKRHVFYNEAFNTLALNHDASKEGFQRVYKTGLFPEEFSKVLQEFCARTYFSEKFDFTEHEFEFFVEQLDCKSWINKEIKWKDLLDDLTDNLCIMNYDNGKIRFIHRSFQEYFCAVYLSRDNDEKYPLMRKFFDSHANWATEDGAFEMLYDLEPQRVEQLIYVPLLRELLCVDNHDPEEQYWEFLENVYGDIYYNVGDVIDEYENVPKSYVYLVLLRKKGLENRVIFIPDVDEGTPVEKYLCVGTNINTKIIYASDFDESKRYTICEDCGASYRISVSEILHDKEELYQIFTDNYFVYHVEFYEMRKILAEMEERIKKSKQTSFYDGMFGKK